YRAKYGLVEMHSKHLLQKRFCIAVVRVEKTDKFTARVLETFEKGKNLPSVITRAVQTYPRVRDGMYNFLQSHSMLGAGTIINNGTFPIAVRLIKERGQCVAYEAGIIVVCNDYRNQRSVPCGAVQAGFGD